MVDWSKLPDIGAVALLTCAFASVSRHNRTPVSKLWLTAWIMIALHFAVSMFTNASGIWGILTNILAASALIWSGMLFMWASVPYRRRPSSAWMMCGLLLGNTLYVSLLLFSPSAAWALTPVALFLGVYPLMIALLTARSFRHTLRWSMVLLYGSLSAFLLAFQHRPGNGEDLALNAVLFTVFFGCCIHFFFLYRRATTGAFITISGFFVWASVFVVGPFMYTFYPQVQVESEVWNLPKYVVAVGMLLLLLEEQLEHNKHLALHDALTGLPNRRLFQDRIASAMERSRRTGTGMALLVIDLNGFKQVNDTLGHHVGDLVLQRVAALFAERVRRSDTVSRTGGDEFSVILEESVNREDAELVGRSLQQLLADPLDLGDHVVRVGASVGIAVFPEDATDAEKLCIAADLHMYDAKRKARNSNLNMPSVAHKPIGSPEPESRTEMPLAQ